MTRFRIIGICPVIPTLQDENPLYMDKVEAIDKAMYEEPWWHYFYHGIAISKNNKTIVVEKDDLNDYSIFDVGKLKVTLCAIVGKNGSGKSSLVDLLIRVINNMTVTLMGEGFNFAAAEHLHFIDHVYADLAFQIESKIYILECRGRKIVLKHFRWQTGMGGGFFYLAKEDMLLESHYDEDVAKVPLKLKRNGRRVLKKLFYTLVCNYSLYGFNFRDYLSEATPLERLKAIGVDVDPDKDPESTVWLKGLFHKNDGYQTPIVLHPMRNNGKLDVSKENLLAKERLCDLLFYQDAFQNYPLRVINGGLYICALRLKPGTRYTSKQTLKKLGIKDSQNIWKNFNHIHNLIIQFWDEQYGILSAGRGKQLKDAALDYIVYKTIKIVLNYRKFRPILTVLKGRIILYENLNSKMEPLAQDYTHITKKLRQTINYLLTDLYLDCDNNYNLKELDELIPAAQALMEKKQSVKNKVRIMKSTLLPPPIFDVELILSKNDNTTIPFNRLSSGERQIAYTISNFMYHLVNVDSEWNDYYNDHDHKQVVKYKYMNVVFDEVELYFHPEMQRRFVGLLMKSLRSVHFNNLKGIHIMMATHSPFLLSDIPSSNVLGLGEKGNSLGSTFGANIMDLLGNTFFMDASIGDIARDEISKIVDLHNRCKTENISEEYKKNKKRFEYVASQLGSPFVQNMVLRMLSEIKSHV